MDKRLTIEEAMTKARVRECKKCNTRFYKTEGCNKMTCTCNAKMCYICRKDISVEQYNHFCQTPLCTHKTCGKCKLFTDTVEDDRLAMRDAGLKVNILLTIVYYCIIFVTIGNARSGCSWR